MSRRLSIYECLLTEHFSFSFTTVQLVKSITFKCLLFLICSWDEKSQNPAGWRDVTMKMELALEAASPMNEARTLKARTSPQLTELWGWGCFCSWVLGYVLTGEVQGQGPLDTRGDAVQSQAMRGGSLCEFGAQFHLLRVLCAERLTVNLGGCLDKKTCSCSDFVAPCLLTAVTCSA